MQIRFLDAHTHVQFPRFDADRAEVVRRAFDAGVGMVNAGTTRETSSAAVRLAEEYPDAPVYAIVGIHPSHASGCFHDVQELGMTDAAKHIAASGDAFEYNVFKKFAENPKVVGIGECGLDYFRIEGNEVKVKESQRALFVEQVKFAFEAGKPLVIHCRAAMTDLIGLLEAHKNFLNAANPGIMHFFSGTKGEARTLLDLGFSFTFGGVVTFTNEYDEVITFIPADRILSETDAPYVAPAPFRGKRNEPAYVVEVVKRLAELKGLSTDAMGEQMLRTAERIFQVKLIL